MYFTGTTGSYATVDSYSSNFTLGTDDFTIQWFQYDLDTILYPRIFSIGSFNNLDQAVAVSIESGNLIFWVNQTPILSCLSNTLVWQHVAIVRKSGILTIYIDGVNSASISFPTYIAGTTNASTILTIGGESQPWSDSMFHGYITDFVWIKGTALYTTNFCPAPPPFIPAADTYLLLLAATEPTVTTDSSLYTVDTTGYYVTWVGTGPTLYNYWGTGFSMIGPQGATGPQGPNFSTLVSTGGSTILTSSSYSISGPNSGVYTFEQYDMNYQGLQLNWNLQVQTGCADDAVFAGLEHVGTPWYIGVSANPYQTWIVNGNDVATGTLTTASTGWTMTEDGIGIYIVGDGVNKATVLLEDVFYNVGDLANWRYYSAQTTGCYQSSYLYNDWTTYTIGSLGAVLKYIASGTLSSYQYEWVNAQIIPPIHQDKQLPLVLTPWHVSHIHTIVDTNVKFWQSLDIGWTGAFYVAMPYTTSQSQTGTTAPSYASGVAYPLWNAIRKRNNLLEIPDNFGTNVSFHIQTEQELVLGIGPSPPNSTGWYNQLLSNRIQQLGANDKYDLDGTTGCNGLITIPDFDPVTIYNHQILYTGQEYSDWFAPFTTGTLSTGCNIPESDQSLYSLSSTYALPPSLLPQPERVIWPNDVFPDPYNNVSYSQMAQAILVLKASAVPFNSLTITDILDEYRNLYVVDPVQYLPLFDREYNYIAANPSWVLISSPTPNKSLAWIMYQ
ncbi:MAG: hypothetical protein EBX37_06065 [Alphaproteobacteria bacterium]|nr:hypothetical protein [Alphaproteobacteria bacterium]